VKNVERHIDQCINGNSYRTKTGIKFPINSHDILKLYKCEECGKGYGARHEPQLHMKIHIRLKPYGC
jgi:hypothetical protein